MSGPTPAEIAEAVRLFQAELTRDAPKIAEILGTFDANERTDSPAYRADYERGWRYSHRETATLDHADAINASLAWMDGYLDYAASRPKWDFLTKGGQA